MSTTVAQLKTSVQGLLPDSASYTDANFLDFVNDLETDIYTRIVKKYDTETITSVANQDNYSYPTGITIDDIDRVFFDDYEYKKIDIRQDPESLNYYSFWHYDSKLYMYPAPSSAVTNGIELICLTKPTKKTATSESLLLPDQFLNLYRYYIYAQICMLLNEDQKAQKWTDMYNTEEQKLEAWYPAPISPVEQINATW